ncbi:Putative membrane glycoprotein [Komagataella phaffii CBS 7435]|uniref:Type I transmembrane sorting receptor for multiple vacuolar hydrolases n=2 Tax=Komagataella phaffii TaxID=460519 RepID=C4R564_KOMPG|nr:uncharacterized protein PAS_chr3_0653 [Komagataella phaffii GS115]AOA64001.1 GQ67_03739T0 [Komagataella phaffii]CAH2449524.1 Putative membrane glycoprotein [Komagataella phaffii CBS 7435]AOA68479.1 GQ68_03711T0 [Komagataella phaffii GS115]CAY70700.1 Type I transmembrane sorting receptor for multiple vacuolar hydrolases [Komagataella phaffii GS115]CCA39506.1 Putative membrane glycoprotein [Komagataella phaffii CBS 7435]
MRTLTLLVYFVVAALAFTPQTNSRIFKGYPKKVVYFDDTASVVYHDGSDNEIYYSKDDGVTWTQLDLGGASAHQVIVHPFDPSTAYILTTSETHFVTTDSGFTWNKVSSPEPPVTNEFPTLSQESSSLTLNSKNFEYVLFAGQCTDGSEICNRKYYYSLDNMRTFNELIEAHSCLFVDTADAIAGDHSPNAVICAITNPDGKLSLVKTANFFKDGIDYVSSGGGLIENPELLGASHNYILAVGSHLLHNKDKFVYISFDGSNFNKVKLNGNTNDLKILDSLPSSVAISAGNALFISSSGSNSLNDDNDNNYFTSKLSSLHVKDNFADYELIDAVEGVILANTNENGNVRSFISTNNGDSWKPLELKSGSPLHLHSVIQRSLSDNRADPGKYYSTPVPGLLLGVGNEGPSLNPYSKGNTYVSTDAGASWTKTLTGPHIFEVGDSGSLIIAIPQSGPTDIIKFSKDFGSSWTTARLGQYITADFITTTPDATSLSFLVVGTNNDDKYIAQALNFRGVYDTVCSESEFEDWYPIDSKGKKICIMGHKQKFSRRKPSAACSVSKLYLEAVSVQEDCPCTEQDFECAQGFSRNSQGKCLADNIEAELALQRKLCVNGATSYEVPSGYQLILGNTCQGSSDLQTPLQKRCPDEPKTVPEAENLDPSYSSSDEKDDNPDEEEGAPEDSKEGFNDGKVKASVFTFDGKVEEYIYLERDKENPSEDETLVAITNRNEAYVSHNQGYSWEQIAPGEDILSIYLSRFDRNHVYLVAANQKIIYSRDRADNWKSFRTPSMPIPGVRPIYFHPYLPHYLIYVGQEGCDSQYSKSCRSVAYFSKSYGKRWTPIQENVNSCQFVGGLQKRNHDNLIICDRPATDSNDFKSQIFWSKDLFKTKTIALENTIGFVQVADYLVAATIEHNDELRAHVSIDGTTWADAYFPPNFRVDKQQAYTTLSGATKSIFLHVTTNPRPNTEFGTILKSNSNGTSYVLSLDNVNRDSKGYVDFEQMSGLEGVIIVNTVDNASAAKKGSRKQLKSKITYNDGAHWSYITPPAIDSDGNKFPCKGKSLEKCSLNLHGYTEREDYRDTFSSQSAIGMMLGVGNVGEHLENYYDGHTFLTKDGGITWKEVKKGVYQWEYGDQGSVIVLVNGKDNTNILYYSVDEGDTFEEFQFTDELVTVQDISTVPNDNSRKFLLFTRVPLAKGDKTRVFQIDFSHLLNRKCSLDLRNEDTDDFELWSPSHPFQPDNCMFGHETQYYRKLPGRLCYIGPKLTQPHKVVRNCACTKEDYECDFNYYRDESGICRLVPGFSPPDHSEICNSESRPVEYWVPTGYRKIPMSTCEGGVELDKVEPKPCPGREESFREKYGGLRGLGLVVAALAGLGVVGFIGLVLYKYYDSKFGQIKLGEEGNFEVFERGGFLSEVNAIVGSILVTGVASVSQLLRGTFLKLGEIKNKVLGNPRGNQNLPSAYVVADDHEDLLNDSFHDDDQNEEISRDQFSDDDIINSEDERQL